MRKLLPLIILLFAGSVDAKNTSISPNAFCSTEILATQWQHGYTWTLTSRLGELLDRAEKLMGERDKSWTVLGVEFSTNQAPQTWYPGAQENRKDVIIQLTQSAATDNKRALFQLAHEVVHLLAPTGKPQTSTVLEEGVATYFSIHVLQAMGIDIKPSYIGHGVYEDAYRRVKKLVDNNPDAFNQIKKLLKDQTFTDISEDEMLNSFKNLNREDARVLSENFTIFSRKFRFK